MNKLLMETDDTTTSIEPIDDEGTGGEPKWWSRRIPLWIALAVLAVGIIGTVAGFAISASEADRADQTSEDLADQVATNKADAEAHETELQEAQEAIDDAEEAQGDAEAQAKTAEAKARAKLEAEYAPKNQALAEREAAVKAREDAVTQAEVARDQNSFGDGVWEVGVDIQPGRYKTAGGGDCYWAKNDAAGDIIDNDLPGGPATVNIEASVFSFKSNNCGEWVKV